jgi:hypothetical protein
MDMLLILISNLFQSGSIGDSWIQIAILIFVLLLVWGIVRFFLRLAFKVFASGCFVILILGLILLAARFL